MANWVKNTACPDCGSKDNLGVYDDGSTFCWGCRSYHPPTISILERYQAQKAQPKEPLYKIVKLPNDAIDVIHPKAELWLAKYDLTSEDFSGCQVLYSYEKDLLIWAFHDDDGNLLMYQGRYFGDEKKYPKYVTYGAKDFLHIVGPKTARVVLVEDICSAAKVSKTTTVMPLFGASLSDSSANRLSRYFHEVVFWLDTDKTKEAIRQKNRILPRFSKVCVVTTPLDPKEYSVEEIEKVLEGL